MIALAFVKGVIRMIISLHGYVRRGRHLLRRWALDPRVHRFGQAAAYLLAGFVLSAASLADWFLPLSAALVCACSGWSAVFAAAGGCLGYYIFWGKPGYMGLLWCAMALPVALLLSRRTSRQAPLLLPAAAALLIAASGVAAQLLFYDLTPVPVYLLRIGLCAGGAWVFRRVLQGRDPVMDWLGTGLLMLSLAQLLPMPYLGLGYLAAGFVTVTGAFPAAAVSGLALDLAQITPVPMAAVLILAYLVRFLPRVPKWIQAAAPGLMLMAMLPLCGVWDFRPLPGLILGGCLGILLPVPGKYSYRRGETGVAQVRLEMAASVLTQTQSLLLEAEPVPVDEEALMLRAAERACGGCAYRKNCKDTTRLAQLPPITLHKPLLSVDELPIVCRKPGRFLAELHRCQEQLRSIRADRQRQLEYRAAVIQQYRFLAAFLQDLADRLPRRAESVTEQYRPEVFVYGNRPEQDNGDRCLRFAGVGKKYYVLLCDGMGTGIGAVQESRTAAQLLQRLLRAGYPAQHALRSLNSLCALRDRPGAVTVDLAELELDKGKVHLYKWGAAPSFIATKYGAERLGTATPPPGISTHEQEQVEHTSLRRGEWLVMVSDGISQRQALQCCMDLGERSPGELAAGLLACGQLGSQDDATVVILRLERE